jgi:hypothetical protein
MGCIHASVICENPETSMSHTHLVFCQIISTLQFLRTRGVNERLCIEEVGVDLELCVHAHGPGVELIMEAARKNNYFLIQVHLASMN